MKEITTDIAIVAAGPSGLAAAAQAAEMGARVAVFEKMNTVGGAANMGMGPLGIGTRQQKAMMVDINVEKAFKMFMDYTHWRVDANLVKRYFESSADTIEWLEGLGVEFAGAYKYFPKSEATWHIVAVNGGIGRNGGAIMNKAMMEHAKQNGAEFYLETPVQRLLLNEAGEASSLIAKDKTGEELHVTAKAVVVATGGAGDNPEMIKQLTGYTYRQDMFNFAIPGLKGDGIRMCREIGAAPTEVNFEMTYVLPDSEGEANCVSVVFMQPNLLVNKQGKRFMNEEEMQNITFTGNAISVQQGKIAYSIVDSTILKAYKRNGVDIVSFVHPLEDVGEFDEAVEQGIANGNPHYFKADTLEELAQKLGIDPAALQDTVDEYNDSCDSTDEQFYKPKQFLRPILKPPFYAAGLHCGAYGTLGGIKINANTEVLKPDWQPIPGLFAAGTDTCTIFGDSYMFLLPGNTMGYCVNTGRFAGEAAADYIG